MLDDMLRKTGLGAPRQARAATRASVAAALPWLVWAILFGFGLALVSRFGVNAPWYDEWGMVGFLGDRTPDLEWLWRPHNDHRIPVPKLVLLGIYEIGGWNFRLAMFANVLLLAAAAALLVRSVARTRGQMRAVDAFIPLVLMNLGHYGNFLWGWQITQVIPVVLVVSLMAVIVSGGLRPGSTALLFGGPAVLALPLSGVPGLVYGPGFALWLAAVGWMYWTDRARWLAAWAWGCSGLTVLAVLLYFVGLESSVQGTLSPIALLKTIVAFSAQGFGPATAAAAPASYLLVFGVGLLGAALALYSFAAAGAIRRGHSAGYLLVLAGLLGLLLAVAVARPGTGSFPPRYYLQAVPLLLWLYVVATFLAPRRIGQPLVGALAVSALAASVFNTLVGIEEARARWVAMEAFAEDVQEGLPPSQLLARHQRTLLPFPEPGGAYWHSGLAAALERLGEAEVGVFAELAPEGPHLALPIETVASAISTDATTTWVLDRPLAVLGVRLVPLEPDENVALPYTRLQWRSAGSAFRAARTYHQWWYAGESPTHVWIDDEVAALRLSVAGHGFPDSLLQIEVIVEAADGTRP